MSIDAGFAAWLQADALYASQTDATLNGRWGANAIESDFMTALALVADANTQAVRDLAILGGPLVIDTHIVPGLRRDLIGKAVTMKGDRLGYDATGKPVFVIGADESGDAETTKLTVIRSLAT